VQTLNLIVKLKTSYGENLKGFHQSMERIRQVLSPMQLMKLLLWIEDNSALIDKASPAWAAERIRFRYSVDLA